MWVEKRFVYLLVTVSGIGTLALLVWLGLQMPALILPHLALVVLTLVAAIGIQAHRQQKLHNQLLKELGERERQNQHIRGLNEKLKAQTDNLLYLHDWSQYLAKTMDKEEIYFVLFGEIARVTGATTMSLTRISKDPHLLRYETAIDAWAFLNVSHIPPLPLNAGVIQQVSQGQVRATRPIDPAWDVTQRQLNGIPHENKQVKTGRILCIPLISHSNITGTVNIVLDQDQTISENEYVLIDTIAVHIATTLEKVRLIAEKQQYANSLEERVATRTATIERLRRQTEAILNNSSDGLIVIYTDGTIRQSNAAFDKMLNSDVDYFFGQNLVTLFTRACHDIVKQAIRDASQTGEAQRIEATIRRTTGETFPADLAIYPIRPDKNHEIERLVGSIRDIAPRVKMETDLRQSLNRERDLNRLKTRFLAMASHEFRTPLSTILTSIELLEMGEGNPTERRAKHYTKVRNGVQFMNTLLEDVLTFGRSEAEQDSVKREMIHIEGLCQEVSEQVNMTYSKDHVIELDVQTPPYLEADAKLLRQILTNLLSNAMKYSDPGTSVWLNVLSQEANHAVIHVKDEGIGIPEKDQQQIFEAFRRAQNVGTVAGTGLGLAIVKRAVELHDGTITLSSKPGEGTEFIVTFPTHFKDHLPDD